MSGQIPGDLWRTIYDIQGDAQQAAEGDRPCRSIEDTWARLEKVLPPPYGAATDLLEALKAMCSDGEWITVEGKMRWCVSSSALERGGVAWTRAEKADQCCESRDYADADNPPEVACIAPEAEEIVADLLEALKAMMEGNTRHENGGVWGLRTPSADACELAIAAIARAEKADA